jgi:hypothetical protein
MAQIEALLFCYLTISFKGFRKTPQSSAREAAVTTTQRTSKETKQFCNARSLVFFFFLLLLSTSSA